MCYELHIQFGFRWDALVLSVFGLDILDLAKWQNVLIRNNSLLMYLLHMCA